MLAKPQHKKPLITPKVYNNTSLTLDAIKQLPYIGQTINKWRQRTIELYAADDGHIISVGTTFDNTTTVIACDSSDAWTTELDYIAHGKVYIYE